MTSAIQLDLLHDAVAAADETRPAPVVSTTLVPDVGMQGRVAARRRSDRFVPDALDMLIAAAPKGEARPANLEACLAYLAAQPNLPTSLLSDARSAVSTLAEKLNRSADSLPADPVLLRPILAEINWAAWGLTRKREANVRSALTSLLLACGWVAPHFRAKARPTPEWEAHLALAEPHKLSGPLGPFGRFCAARGIGPREVRNEHLLAYQDELEVASLYVVPRDGAAKVSCAWKRLRQKEATWPQVELGLPSAVVWKACRIEHLPPSFQAELPAFLDAMRRPDPLDKDAGQALREISVQHGRRAILRAAAYLIQSGHKTIDEIDRLAVLVEPAAFRALLLAAYAEADDAWTYASHLMVGQLMNLACRWVKPEPAALTELREMRKMVKPPKPGLSRAVRDRLAQFDDPDVRDALFALPQLIWAEADRQFRLGRRKQAAKLHEDGIMVAILLTQPVRRLTLASVDIEEHLVRNRKGALHRIKTVPGILKTPVLVDVDLPPELASRIEKQIRVYRPHVPGHDLGTALFPSPSGRHLSANQTGRRVTRVIMEQLGARMPPHDARHLAVKLLLDDNPENLVVAQRLLGHATPKTTEKIYGAARTSAAQRQYAVIVEQLCKKAGKREAAREQRKSRKNTP